jgi:hypothetical protein
MFWLVYSRGTKTEVLIYPSSFMLLARLKIGISGYDGDFVEGYRLDQKVAAKIPRKSIGKPLSRKRAEDLLRKL